MGREVDWKGVERLTLYRPVPSWPLVMTWMVALVPSAMLRLPGIGIEAQQKSPGPVSKIVGQRALLKASPGSLPSAMKTET